MNGESKCRRLFIEMKDIEAFDLRIDIGDGWIAVHDDAGNTLLHERAELDGWPVANRGIVADPEPLRRWMELHLRGVVEKHKALLVAVSPDITDAPNAGSFRQPSAPSPRCWCGLSNFPSPPHMTSHTNFRSHPVESFEKRF